MLPRLRQRHAGRGQEGRSRMIDELLEQFDYSRKHAIKLLNGRAGWGGEPGLRRGRPPVYGPEEVAVRRRLWRAAEQPWGKRLVALLELWLPFYEQEYGALPRRVRRRVLGISAAQGDRLLRPHKARVGAQRHQAGQPAQAADPGAHRPRGHHPARLSGGRHGGPLRGQPGGQLCLERHRHRHFERLDGQPGGVEQGRGRGGGRHEGGGGGPALRAAGL